MGRIPTDSEISSLSNEELVQGFEQLVEDCAKFLAREGCVLTNESRASTALKDEVLRRLNNLNISPIGSVGG